jgi:drug/metabolite transporter (DMT)-like permease
MRLNVPSPGNPVVVNRTGEKVFGVLAIVVGVVLTILAGVGANIPPVVLLLITLVVIAWVTYYFVVVRPAATGEKRPNRGAERETE